MANINTNDLKCGYIINHNKSLWKVISTEHVKPGKGGAFIQAELRNIKNGSKLNERFRAGEKVDRLIMDSTEVQFSYKNHDTAIFLNLDTFEEVNVEITRIGDSHLFLKEGQNVKMETIEDDFISIVIPEKMIFKVIETEPEIKGATLTNVQKPAILENGMKIMVPSFIKEGEDIIISTQDKKYSERA